MMLLYYHMLYGHVLSCPIVNLCPLSFKNECVIGGDEIVSGNITIDSPENRAKPA